MITEIASVVGGCVFAGLTMICVAQFFARNTRRQAGRLAIKAGETRQDLTVSALGQKRTFAAHLSVSVLPLIATWIAFFS